MEKEHDDQRGSSTEQNRTYIANQFLTCMPRHFWANLFSSFRQEMKWETEKGLRWWCCVVFSLFLSEFFSRQAMQKTEGYIWVLQGSNVKPGSWNRDGRAAGNGKRFLYCSHRNQSQKASEQPQPAAAAAVPASTNNMQLPGTLLIHVFFFSPHPNNSSPFQFPTEFPNANTCVQNKVLWTHAWKLPYSRCVRRTFSTIQTKPAGIIGLYSCTCYRLASLFLYLYIM